MNPQDPGVDAALLLADTLSFSYPGRPVFAHWSARFEAGLTWLRGPNGCGKSTLLKLLAGALPPLTGRLRAAGVDAAADPLGYRRQVFWCGTGAPAFDHLRPGEFFGFMATLYPRFSAEALTLHVNGFALAPHAGQRLAALSSGTQRKVWVAAALASGCPVLLLDEPANALDAASLAHLQAALQRAATKGGQALLLASHEELGAATAQARVLELQA